MDFLDLKNKYEMNCSDIPIFVISGRKILRVKKYLVKRNYIHSTTTAW